MGETLESYADARLGATWTDNQSSVLCKEGCGGGELGFEFVAFYEFCGVVRRTVQIEHRVRRERGQTADCLFDFEQGEGGD